MKRTKKPKNETRSVTKSKPGVKSSCTPEVIKRAEEYALLGLTNWQMAQLFEVSTPTISYWKSHNLDFKAALNRGGVEADKKVSKTLFKLANGFTYESVKLFKVNRKKYDKDGNITQSWEEIIEYPIMEYIPPNVKAAIKWLQTRQPAQWADTQKVQHEHKHLHANHSEINIHAVLEQAQDQFSIEELKTLKKLGIQAGKQPSQGQEVMVG